MSYSKVQPLSVENPLIRLTHTLILTLILLFFFASISSGASISDLAANPYAFNSFADNTNITYTLTDVTGARVMLKLLDSGGNPVKTVDAGLQNSGFNAIAWDGSAESGLPVPEGIYGALLSVSTTGADTYRFALKWGSYGTGNGQFNGPFDATVDSSGNVYVIDFFNNRVEKFDSNGGFITKWGVYGLGSGQLYFPRGIAVDSSGNVYVVDSYRVQKFTSDGRFITTWGGLGYHSGLFIFPYRVAVDPSGNVYVTDRYAHRVFKFTSDGRLITKWGSYGTGSGQFNHPTGITVDSSGNVYVTDYFNHRVQKFDSNGRFIMRLGSFGTGDGQFHYPTAVTADSSGSVYVSDATNYIYERYEHRIQKFTPDGRFITKWGSTGSGNGQFKGPYGIAVDSSGYVYVSDYNNNRVQKFSPPGTTVSATTSVLVDNTPPQVSINTPADGAVYILNQNVLANWSASDLLSGMASAAGSVKSGEAIDTSFAGTKGVSVTATDNAGNQTTKTVIYYVRYGYSGILPPINPDGTSVFKLGRTVPVKFRLTDFSGGYISTAAARLYLAKVVDGVVGSEIEAASAGGANTGNYFRYDTTGNQYIFNLDTKDLSAGEWQLRISLDDGTSKYVAMTLR
ncbi:MAG: SBBP repeat-containing protein [Deltaproteobacteria bacterium]|nr:SBBP repeat-containing protein [Deltaproteobacteria bacterium]